jgi:hypothetical protein
MSPNCDAASPREEDEVMVEFEGEEEMAAE